jgi:hypothetical protein
MSLQHGSPLLGSHRKRKVASARDWFAGSQRVQHGFDVFDAASHPLAFGIFELLLDQCSPNLMVGKR